MIHHRCVHIRTTSIYMYTCMIHPYTCIHVWYITDVSICVLTDVSIYVLRRAQEGAVMYACMCMCMCMCRAFVHVYMCVYVYRQTWVMRLSMYSYTCNMCAFFFLGKRNFFFSVGKRGLCVTLCIRTHAICVCTHVYFFFLGLHSSKAGERHVTRCCGG